MTTNAEIVQAFFAMVGARDLKLIDLFADEFDWHVPGAPHFPWSGNRTRKDQIPAFFEALWPMTVEGETQVRVDHFIVADSHVIMTGAFDHRVVATGERFTIAVAFHFIIADGKIVHMHMYEDSLAAAHAFSLGLTA